MRIRLVAHTKVLGSLFGSGMPIRAPEAFKLQTLTTTRDGQDNPSMHVSLSKLILDAIACMNIPCWCRSDTNFWRAVSCQKRWKSQHKVSKHLKARMMKAL